MILGVENEALLSADWKTIKVPTKGFKVDEELITDFGWTLKLKDGWRIEKKGND